MDPLIGLVSELAARSVRFVLIGVAGANYYAVSGSTIFGTQDRDIFLPLDPANLLEAWRACEASGLSLVAGAEPLDVPRDLPLAERVVERRANVRATNGAGFDVDLTLVMTGFEFEGVWAGRRVFEVEGISLPVARLAHIIASKHATGRDKDRLFLATHRQALEDLLRNDH